MNFVYVAPFKSVAVALVLVILFGPLGLLYSSLLGGVLMTFILLASFGMAIAKQSFQPVTTVWLLCILWSMISVRMYNNKLLKKLSGNNAIVTPKGSVDSAVKPRDDKAAPRDNNAEPEGNQADTDDNVKGNSKDQQ